MQKTRRSKKEIPGNSPGSQIELTVFTRHPSKAVLPVLHKPDHAQKGWVGEIKIEPLNETPAHVTELDLKAEVFIPLVSKADEFKRTGNPILVIEAFLIAHQVGLYPPLWVQERLAGAFGEYHQAQGLKSLDKILGLKGGKRFPPSFKALLLEHERDENLCGDVFRLNLLFKIPPEEAAKMVEARERIEFEDRTAWGIQPISASRIFNLFRRKWRREFIRRGYKETALAAWPEETRREFLLKFPKDSPLYKDFSPKTKKKIQSLI